MECTVTTSTNGITMCSPNSHRLHVKGVVSQYHVSCAKRAALQILLILEVIELLNIARKIPSDKQPTADE